MAFERLHQGLGKRGQEPAKRVGLEALSTRARTEHIPLRLLDPILGLAALTVESVVERLIAVVAGEEIADDETRVDALCAVFESGHHAPGGCPNSGRRGRTRRSLFASRRFVRRPLSSRIRPAPLRAVSAHFWPTRSRKKQTAHAVVLTPAQQPLATEPRITANKDAGVGPVCMNGFHQRIDQRRGILGPIDAAVTQVSDMNCSKSTRANPSSSPLARFSMRHSVGGEPKRSSRPSAVCRIESWRSRS